MYAAVYLRKVNLKNKEIVLFSDNDVFDHLGRPNAISDEDYGHCFFLCADNNISITIMRHPGYKNVFADVLQVADVLSFKSIYQEAVIPEAISTLEESAVRYLWYSLPGAPIYPVFKVS